MSLNKHQYDFFWQQEQFQKKVAENLNEGDDVVQTMSLSEKANKYLAPRCLRICFACHYVKAFGDFNSEDSAKCFSCATKRSDSYIDEATDDFFFGLNRNLSSSNQSPRIISDPLCPPDKMYFVSPQHYELLKKELKRQK